MKTSNQSWLLILRIMLTGLVTFGFIRLGLLWMNRNQADGIPLSTILKSFIIGMRFDMVIISILLFPLVLWFLIPFLGWQYRKNFSRVFPWLFSLLATPLLFFSIAEFYFYKEFHDRYNRLAIQYIKEDPETVFKMIWNEYPVLFYGLVSLSVAFLVAVWFRKRLFRYHLPESFSWKEYFKKKLPVGLLILCLLTIGARGGIQSGPPVRWGDAFFSKYLFANHLALNGVYTFIKSFLNLLSDERHSYWEKYLPSEEALSLCRNLVKQKDEALIFTKEYPLFRFPLSRQRILFDPIPENVVVIIMESLSAEVTGALGATNNATPFFDALAKQGILFERFFSQGTHTHQGVFASMCSFPNVPGHEYLMQDDLGNQPFCSLPRIFKKNGYVTGYVYNGSFRWDNQEGFFRNQGMDYFVGKDDYIDPSFMDETWGVSDEDMFLQSVEEISKTTRNSTNVFYLLQTLSNHVPFNLPPPAPFADLHGPKEYIPRLNGVRYGDFALQQFFKEAEKTSWFSKTLFIILGDHGFGYAKSHSQMDISIQHVPLLFYYPEDRMHRGIRVKTVASQVDLLPTIIGLLKIRLPHQSWGRNIFQLPENDTGFAIIKPSGNRDVVSLIQGDEFIVCSPNLPSSSYRYNVNPFNVCDIVLHPEELKKRERILFSYIGTALKTLKYRKAGVTDSDYEIALES